MTKHPHPLTFWKMEALGNDFVVLNGRTQKVDLTPANIQKVSDRHYGIGCDQILIIESSDIADAKITIFNADGSRAEMCGNGMRAVGLYLKASLPKALETDAGVINVHMSSNLIQAAMGPHREVQPVKIFEETGFHVNIGNPHTVFFKESIDTINISEIGPKIENYPEFPHKTNVEFVEVLSPYRLKIRIWERGAGETLACGSGACAVVLAYWHHFGIKSAPTEVLMPGGSLKISLQDGQIYQEGPARFVFQGSLTPEFFNDE